MIFKVLTDNGLPAHGGSGAWPLPKGDGPGAWLEAEGALELCASGLHLTSDPLVWWKPNTRVYVAEADPVGAVSDGSDKMAFRRARLVAEITTDWPYLPMFPRVRCFLAASARSRDKTADISWANLAGAYLERANLEGANLELAYLERAYLAGANLEGANLERAYLERANLEGSYLAGARLAGAYLAGARLNGAYRPTDPPAGWKPDAYGYLRREA